MWSGSDVARRGRDAADSDGGDDSTADVSFEGRLVDTVTAGVADMGVNNAGESKGPFSLSQIMDPARGAESHPLYPCIPAFIYAALVRSRR